MDSTVHGLIADWFLIHRPHAVIRVGTFGIRVHDKVVILQLFHAVGSVLVVNLVDLLSNVGAGNVTPEVQRPRELQHCFVASVQTLENLERGS